MPGKPPCRGRHLSSRRCLKFSGGDARQPIRRKNHGRLTTALQKISNIFG